MTNIFVEGDTCIECEEDNLIVRCHGNTTCLPIKQIETVTELSPCATLGKYMDVRVVALKSSTGEMLLIPTSKGGAHQVLKGIQQLRLRSAFQNRDQRQSL